MARIAVIGVTGTVGSRVAAGLTTAGHDVVGISRNGGAAPAGIQRMAADLTDPEAAHQALEGTEALYLTPPESGDDPLGLERSVVGNVIEAARRRGLGHVVMHTAVHSDRGATGVRILDNKHPLETMLAESGVPFTVLRPAWYVQNLFGARAWLEQGMFSMPWPIGNVWAGTDVQDLARAAVALLESGPANRGFDVHLPGGISAAQVGEAVERVTGQVVGYQEAPDARSAVEPYPISDTHKELYAELYDYFREEEYLGDPGPITEQIEGFEYGTLEEFIRRELFPA